MTRELSQIPQHPVVSTVVATTTVDDYGNKITGVMWRLDNGMVVVATGKQDIRYVQEYLQQG